MPRARKRNYESPPDGFLEGSRHKQTVYHGTDRRPSVGHSLSPEHGSEHGIFVSPRHRYARKYGRHLAKARISAKSPIFVDSKGEISPGDLTRSIVQGLKRKGYDSIVVLAPSGDPQEIVLFDREQVWVTDVD